MKKMCNKSEQDNHKGIFDETSRDSFRLPQWEIK